jgi:hypothetical protein
MAEETKIASVTMSYVTGLVNKSIEKEPNARMLQSSRAIRSLSIINAFIKSSNLKEGIIEKLAKNIGVDYNTALSILNDIKEISEAKNAEKLLNYYMLLDVYIYTLLSTKEDQNIVIPENGYTLMEHFKIKKTREALLNEQTIDLIHAILLNSKDATPIIISTAVKLQSSKENVTRYPNGYYTDPAKNGFKLLKDTLAETSNLIGYTFLFMVFAKYCEDKGMFIDLEKENNQTKLSTIYAEYVAKLKLKNLSTAELLFVLKNTEMLNNLIVHIKVIDLITIIDIIIKLIDANIKLAKEKARKTDIISSQWYSIINEIGLRNKEFFQSKRDRINTISLVSGEKTKINAIITYSEEMARDLNTNLSYEMKLCGSYIGKGLVYKLIQPEEDSYGYLKILNISNYSSYLDFREYFTNTTEKEVDGLVFKVTFTDFKDINNTKITTKASLNENPSTLYKGDGKILDNRLNEIDYSFKNLSGDGKDFISEIEPICHMFYTTLFNTQKHIDKKYIENNGQLLFQEAFTEHTFDPSIYKKGILLLKQEIQGIIFIRKGAYRIFWMFISKTDAYYQVDYSIVFESAELSPLSHKDIVNLLLPSLPNDKSKIFIKNKTSLARVIPSSIKGNTKDLFMILFWKIQSTLFEINNEFFDTMAPCFLNNDTTLGKLRIRFFKDA